jgi:plastocyanin
MANSRRERCDIERVHDCRLPPEVHSPGVVLRRVGDDGTTTIYGYRPLTMADAPTAVSLVPGIEYCLRGDWHVCHLPADRHTDAPGRLWSTIETVDEAEPMAYICEPIGQMSREALTQPAASTADLAGLIEQAVRLGVRRPLAETLPLRLLTDTDALRRYVASKTAADSDPPALRAPARLPRAYTTWEVIAGPESTHERPAHVVDGMVVEGMVRSYVTRDDRRGVAVNVDGVGQVTAWHPAGQVMHVGDVVTLVRNGTRWHVVVKAPGYPLSVRPAEPPAVPLVGSYAEGAPVVSLRPDEAGEWPGLVGPWNPPEAADWYAAQRANADYAAQWANGVAGAVAVVMAIMQIFSPVPLWALALDTLAWTCVAAGWPTGAMIHGYRRAARVRRDHYRGA